MASVLRRGSVPVSLEVGWVLDSRVSAVGGDWAQECRPVGSVERALRQLHGAARFKNQLPQAGF